MNDSYYKSVGLWKCQDGLQCINRYEVCDGKHECNDKSDEDPLVCTQYNCHPRKWKCQDGLQCINRYEVCDGKPECNDRSDEDSVVCTHWKCRAGYWKCKDKPQCIEEALVCDGEHDCNDRSDEDPAVCTQYNCTVKCQDGLQCIDWDEVYFRVLVLKYGESNAMGSALNTWQMPLTVR